MKKIYLIYGADKTQVYNEFHKLLRTLKTDDVVKYDMMNSSLLDVIEDVSTVGLFCSLKVIVVEDCYFLSANKTIEYLDRLEDFIEKSNSDNYCVFLAYMEKVDTRKKIYKLLSKNARIIALPKVDQQYLEKYVKEILEKEGYCIESISYFLEKVGTSLYNIKNELDKLMAYKIDSKSICNQDIDRVTVLTIEEEIFALSDAIIARNTSKAFTLLEEFLNKSYDEIQIIMLLASQFRFLFQVKRLLNKNKTEGEIAKILEVNPYRVKYTLKKLYVYSEDVLLEYIQKLAKMDHDIKLGLMDKRLALELFVIGNRGE